MLTLQNIFASPEKRVFAPPAYAVPGFGPNLFGGPPGHMGPMQPGKNQVVGQSSLLFVVCSMVSAPQGSG